MNAKEIVSRIPLDYYKHPDRMVRTKRLLTWGAGILTVLWIGSVFVPAGERAVIGDRRFSHGPVANVHQPIDAECAACHVNFALFASGKPFKGDQKCQQCHYEGDLATHHGSQKESMTPNCGSCHSDHHGRDWNLNRVADRDCTTCHKDLKDSMTEGDPHYDNKVTSFADQHPEFRDLKTGDPGKLKFNHKYHMTPGIVLAPGGKPFTLADLPAGAARTLPSGRSEGQGRGQTGVRLLPHSGSARRRQQGHPGQPGGPPRRLGDGRPEVFPLQTGAPRQRQPQPDAAAQVGGVHGPHRLRE